MLHALGLIIAGFIAGVIVTWVYKDKAIALAKEEEAKIKAKL